MADVIAQRLLAALPPGQSPSSATVEPSLPDGCGGPAAGAADPPANDTFRNLEKWSDELESVLLAPGNDGGGRRFRDDPGMTSPELEDAANALHRAIVGAVASSPRGDHGAAHWDDDDGAARATERAAESLSTDSAEDTVNNLDLRCLAGLLRAAGLFLRWAALAPSVSETSNPAARLKSKESLMLYAKILDMDSTKTTATETETVTATATSPAVVPDAPRFASVCLFRATYGDASAIRHLVNSLDGCSYLMRALLRGGQPVPRLFSILRNIHHLVAVCPEESIPRMEGALKIQTAETMEDGTQKCSGLSEILIATLAWAYRSEPPFPGSVGDRRPDLVLEILRALYALDGSGNYRPPEESMTAIGTMLCELLRLSSADERVYRIKLSVVALLLNAPEGYAQYLANNDGIPPLVDILSYQTSLVVVERTGSSAEDAAAVVPVLLALLKLTKSNAAAKQIVWDSVFPPDAEESFQAKASAEIAKGTTEGAARAKNMAPLDAPKGTLRWKLIRLMTWLDSNVKRSVCELLWVLCDEDATQFVLRTGFGNAIHFLGIRGCVDLPAGVDV